MGSDPVLHDEYDILLRIHSGDEEAFRQLVERYYAPLVSFAWRLVGSRDTAEDILQDIWLRIWRLRETIDPSQSLRAYLYLAVRRAAIDRKRTAEREQNAFRNLEHMMSDAVDDESPFHNVAQDDLSVVIEQAIRTLPLRCRESWALVREQGMSHLEAANIMNVSVNTVRAQMTKALKILRRALEGYLLVCFFIHI